MAGIHIPREATIALRAIQETLGSTVVAVSLYGSAVDGGLRAGSDVDILAIVNAGLPELARQALAGRLLQISGRVGNKDLVRPLEITVVNLSSVVPWKYPPEKEFVYGEWLRSAYERGNIPAPSADPDLAILLSQIRSSGIALAGPAPSELLDTVPMGDVRKAMAQCLPGLVESTRGDERNVILTLARMWVTAATGEFLPKDRAAQWAFPRLTGQHAALLALAECAYRGERMDRWEGMEADADGLVDHLKKEVECCLAEKA